jgi:F0F1-type ATP synthase delta subunit
MTALRHSAQGVDCKYALSLYRAAKRLSIFRQVEAEVNKFKQNIESEGQRLVDAIKSPLLSSSQKQRIIAPFLLKLERDSLVSKFIDLIAGNGRLSNLKDIMDAFIQICESQKQCSYVSVTSAKVRRSF